jgi:predicted DNA-binding transcriptional regulator AlpA
MAAKADLPPIPAALADVAMIDAPSIASAAGISISLFHDLVRLREAPPPVIRAPRCTRWLLADVRTWLIERAALGTETDAARTLITTAHRASKAAQAKRQATRAKPTTATAGA